MSNDEKVLIAVRAKIVITSRLAGSYPSVDGITTEFMKNELTIQNAIHSCKMGFSGKVCIHPPQISHVNRAFSYLKQEIEWVPRLCDWLNIPMERSVMKGKWWINRYWKSKRILAHSI